MKLLTNGKRLSVTNACQADGETIEKLLAASNYHPELLEFIDWMDVGNYWLKATRDGRLVGCVQLVFARPIARLEYLSVADDLEPYVQAKIVRELLDYSYQQLINGGAQAVSSTIPFSLKVAKRQLKKRGSIATEQGNIMTKRLR